MLSDKKPVSMRIVELLIYSSHFKQMVGQESRSIATEGRKQEAEEFATEFHVKTRKIQKQRHGRKQKHSHGLTRNFTENTRKIHAQFIEQKGGQESRSIGLATEGRTSRSISHGLTRKQDTAFRAGCVSDGNTHSLGARLKGSNGGVAVGLPHRNSSVFKQAHIN